MQSQYDWEMITKVTFEETIPKNVKIAQKIWREKKVMRSGLSYNVRYTYQIYYKAAN